MIRDLLQAKCSHMSDFSWVGVAAQGEQVREVDRHSSDQTRARAGDQLLALLHQRGFLR